MEWNAKYKTKEAKVKNKTIKRNPFTLIELLLVISIIAILFSLLLPGLKVARATAKSIQCCGNLKQVGIATAMYASDYNGMVLIYTYDGTREVTWTQALLGTSNYGSIGSDYIKSTEVLLCPSYPPDAYTRYLSYGSRKSVPAEYRGGTGNYYYLKLYNIKSPSSYIHAGDTAWGILYGSYPGQAYNFTFWAATNYGGLHLRHPASKANILMGDGSASSCKMPTLKDYGVFKAFDLGCNLVD
jgi:prepilin-type processing-associated H-X9-DG protein